MAAGLLQIAPIAFIVVFGYFLIWRPQQQKQKQLRDQLNAIKRGDRVVTAGGILGTVAKLRDGVNEVDVDIAPNVRVVVLRDTITGVIAPVAANDAK
jgi:preprotein translocase subunit YajC